MHRRSPFDLRGAFVLLLLFLSSSAFSALSADTVILKSGQEVDGRIINQSQTTITIQTRNGVQTLPKGNVRRVFYGDAYRKQQDELKRKREEEQKRKEEEEKRQAEEEAKRLEEEKRQAEKDAAREAEKDRLAEEQRKADEQARLEEQRRKELEGRNPYSMWLYLGPAELELLPENLRFQTSLFNVVNQDLEIQAPLEESTGGMLGLGFAIPIWDLVFVQAEGVVMGEAPEFAVIESQRDLINPGFNETQSGFGFGKYARMLRVNGDFYVGYRTHLKELLDYADISIEGDWAERLRIEPLIGYRFMEHDANFSFTTSGISSFGPSLYLADEETDIFHSSRGISWGIRFFYQPLVDLPLNVEVGLYASRLSGDTSYDIERLNLYNLGQFSSDISRSSLFSRMEAGTVQLGLHYEFSAGLDVFVRLHGETIEYKTERIGVERENSSDPSVVQTNVIVAAISPLVSPFFDTEESIGSLQIGITRRF